MSCSNKNKHLTLEERIIILTGIENGSTKVAIAKTLGKEIALYRLLKHKSPLPLECTNYKKCTHSRHYNIDCHDFVAFTCSRRDCSPGVCNSCSNYRYCHFNKYFYSAVDTHDAYKIQLVDSRLGVNLTLSDAIRLGNIIKPLIDKGQSPYQIVTNHPELGICEKTLYNYIETNVFSCVGLHTMDLRLKSKRRMSKKKSTIYKKRKDRKYLAGRLYKEYLEYYPSASVVEIDTVYNDVSHGPFIQTFKFLNYSLLLGIYHETKTAQDMVEGVNILEQMLGQELFIKYVQVLKTDRGSEFTNTEDIEIHKGITRTRVYYCDPMQSGQKGSLENNHKELRYILPKETNLRELGLINQEALNIVLSHINSAPKEKLMGKSAIEMTRFLNPKLLEKCIKNGLEEIEKDKVALKPYLLKKNNKIREKE